ncbi:hypothetical protein BST61_g4819 [Cercospora zeina]
MSPGRLSNRIAIVTGSSSGLGRSIALQLAAEGAKICCIDLYEKPRNKTNAATGKADDYKNRVEKYNRIDILCNNAGISIESTQPTPLPIHQLPESDWDLTMTINIKSVFLGTKHVLARMITQPIPPGLPSRGRIINTASVQGLVAYHNTPAILPNDAAKQREIDAAHPLGGMGSTEDVAKAVLFLASDDCAWITGVNLPVDGGYMIT